MVSTRRKTLPRDFEELLAAGDLEALKRVFRRCLPDATTGSSKHTTIAFDACPDELARWLVANGADVNARDTHQRTALHARRRGAGIDVLVDLGADVHAVDYQGETPLHQAATFGRLDAARALVGRGADVGARDRGGMTPLARALESCSNAGIVAATAIAEVLLAAGASIDERMPARVRAIGEAFEFSRTAFNPETLAETDAALTRLYTLFEVEPVAALQRHDGVARIEIGAEEWPAQHAELWNLLVPARGPATTVQGEAVRISGRLGHEILGNGGANWDANFRQMCDALATCLGSATALPAADLSEGVALTRSIRAGSGDRPELSRLTELTVRWVLLNPEPTPLGETAYRR
jgi:hypothetical protein